MTLLVLAAGIATGAIGSLLGLGGGFFLVPLLVLAFGVPVKYAVSAGLAAVIATSSAAAATNIEKGLANMRLGMVLETATVLGALTGGFSAAFLPERIVIGIFGLVLAAVSVPLWKGRPSDDPDVLKKLSEKGYFPAEYYDAAAEKTVSYSVKRVPVGLGLSFLAGNISGLLGVGGGVIKVPSLHLLCGVPMKAAAATSNFMIGVTAAAGALVYFSRGDVDWNLCGAIVIGIVLGTRIGAWLNKRLKDRSIRRVFSAIVVVLSVLMLHRAYGG